MKKVGLQKEIVLEILVERTTFLIEETSTRS